jgi:plastocyanin
VGSRTPVLAIATVALLAVAGCGGGNDNGKTQKAQNTSSSSTINGQKATNKGTADVSTTKSTELELDDFYFKPTVLRGKPGESLELELKNEGKVEHSFTLPDQKVDQDLEPDASAAVTVKLPKSGTLLFFCKYHQAQGMRGGLQVSGAAASAGQGSSAGQSNQTAPSGSGY